MTVDKLRFNLGNTNYDVPTKEYVDLAINNIGSGSSSNTNDSSQSINLNDTPIGYITWQMALMPDYLKLDGTDLANASTNYKELLDYATNNNLITNDVDNKVLFKYNDSTDILTLPNYIDLVLQGGNTVEEKEAGLPNITGETAINYNCGFILSTASSNGALTKATQYDYYIGGSKGNAYGLGLDASQSNPIYGNSDTVQPPAIILIPQIKYRKDTYNNVFYNDTPIGTIISYMGITAPRDYLICDGTIYNITDYKALADFINTQFGSYNYFGGDGTTTFAVPDLRGEFLRGTGTNSHTNQGSGASVGVHQDGTNHIYMQYRNSINPAEFYNRSNTNSGSDIDPQNTDNKIETNVSNAKTAAYKSSYTCVESAKQPLYYISRPTNTSVLYCIKYNTSVLSTPENNYSTEEQRIGMWIDGKPLYQITIQDTMPTTTSYTTTDKNIDISNLKLKYISNCFGYLIRISDNLQIPINAMNYIMTNNISLYTISFVRKLDTTKDYFDTLVLRTSSPGDSECQIYITLQYTKTTD